MRSPLAEALDGRDRGATAAAMRGRTLRRLTLSDPECTYIDLGPKPNFCLMITVSLAQPDNRLFLYWREEED